jgi:RNA polymerase sigma factor (sigma-70 family)
MSSAPFATLPRQPGKEKPPLGGCIGVTSLRSRDQPLTLRELETVYRRDGAAFERVAIAIVGDEQLGCDAVHDAFVRAVRSRERFRRNAPVEAWLWRIVINEARKHRANEARMLAADPNELDHRVALNGAGDLRSVRALVAALPDRQRLTLFLRYYADLDYATIAEALGVKPGTVAATLHAARERLAVQLKEVPEWEL